MIRKVMEQSAREEEERVKKLAAEKESVNEERKEILEMAEERDN